MRLTQSDQ